MMRLTCALLLALVSGLTAAGQQSEIPADIRQLVEKGEGAALETRLGTSRQPRDLHLIAQAFANEGRQARRTSEREAAFAESYEYYGKWIDALADDREMPLAKRDVQVAAARVEAASMILLAWAARDLDEYELTAGLRFERERLLTKLRQARGQYDEAWDRLSPLVDDLNAREDEFLAQGIYDTIITLRLDLLLARAWANYYLGLLEESEDARTTALQQAETSFRELTESAYVGRMIYQCYLGLGMTLRAQGRFEDALGVLGNIPRWGDPSVSDEQFEDVETTLRVQVRYELARVRMAKAAEDAAREEWRLAHEACDAARAELAPLVDLDLTRQPPAVRAAAFYVNLARILYANSYLIEARYYADEARNSRYPETPRRQARETRDRGLAEFRKLAKQGGSWPAIARIYIAANAAREHDLTQLSPLELLYAAKELAARDQHQEALERLVEAQGREGVDDELRGDLLFDLGAARYQTGDTREAAEAFAELAREYPQHEQAAEAATNAYKLWLDVARNSQSREDFDRLADVLLNLLSTYSDHPMRVEATWDLAVALQKAGRLDRAVAEFAKVPQESPHWEEAQFRSALCARLAVEQTRGTAEPEAYRSAARDAAQRLQGYARAALERAEAGENPEEARRWAAEALVSAAELLVAAPTSEYEAALELVADFGERFDQPGLTGRVLGVRIRAYRGLRDFEKAAATLDEFLAQTPPERAGAVLASLAAGMREEVERLRENQQMDAARNLAREAIGTFEQLQKWVQANEARAANAEMVRFGLAQMYFYAGEYEQAQPLIDELVAANPQNGRYLRLQALLLTEQLPQEASAGAITRARQAWERILAAPRLREQAPQRYWEARYHWLALTQRLGDTETVRKVLKELRIWTPELGGPPWKGRLEALWEEIGGESAPAEDAAAAEARS